MSRSSAVHLWPLTLAAFVFVLVHLHTAEAVQCYVCSWSPTDTNRADICTRANFSDTVRTHTCDLGCESVSVFDKNGKMEFFYRNCAQNVSHAAGGAAGHHHHHGPCRNETSKAITKEICTCHSNYCNQAPSSMVGTSVFVTAVLLAVTSALRM